MSYSAPISVIAGLLGATIIFVGLKTEWATVDGNRFDTTAAAIGEALLDPFVLPFEVASVVLMVAMIGAIILVRPSEGEES